MACQLAKQTRKSEGTSTKKIKADKDGALKKNILRPGAMVSSDQFVSSVPGRLPNTYGREKESEKYVGGTIFIDEASGYFGLYNQVSLGATETIKAKHSFERDAIRHGIIVKGYRADNSVYRTQAFRDDIEKFGQNLQFCGVGAHHQNGIAERGIRTVSTAARAIMLHALIHWPEHVSLDLWPFAIKYAVYLWNRLPRGKSGLSPSELYFDTKSVYQELHAAKVWGCPAYVLDPRIQDGKKIPRWNPRSKMGQFLGRSDEHAGSIGLIRNLKTGAVSTQFHVVYDNHFSTVTSDWTADNVPVPPSFHDLYKFSRENHFDKEDLIVERRRRQLVDSDRTSSSVRNEVRAGPGSVRASAPEGEIQDHSSQQIRASQHSSDLQEPSPVTSTPTTSIQSTSNSQDNRPHIDESPDSGDVSVTYDEDVPPTTFSPARTRSGKQFRAFHVSPDTSYISFVLDLSERMDTHDAFLLESDLNTMSNSTTRCYEAYNIYQQLNGDLDISTGVHPLAFSARANAEDTPRFHEAMKGPDREGFIEAMKNELEQLSLMNAFTAVPRQKAIDENKPIIDSIWAFKRKRFPDGAVKKLKARFCVRGDIQKESVDYFDTYSPVVQWTTVRLLLIASIVLNLETKQVDFTLAFVQAKAEPGTYIEMPTMFGVKGYVLELHRNLYGQCDAPLKFYEHLKNGLEQRGFKASDYDPCFFKSKHVLILTYCDDCIFFSKKEKDIDDIIDSLKRNKLKDGTVAE